MNNTINETVQLPIQEFIKLFKNGYKDFSGLDLTKNMMSGMEISYINLSRSNLIGCQIVGSIFRHINFRLACLDKIYGPDCHIIDSDLNSSSLVNADLSGSNLSRSRLANANLTGASLIDANLENADLQNANLDGCCLIGANLCGVNLQGTHLHRANIFEAQYNSDTIFDRSFDIDRANLIDFDAMSATRSNSPASSTSKPQPHQQQPINITGPVQTDNVQARQITSQSTITPSLTTERSGVLARLAMQYGLVPVRAMPVASAWISAQDNRTWKHLEWALDAGIVTIRDGMLIDVPVSSITISG